MTDKIRAQANTKNGKYTVKIIPYMDGSSDITQKAFYMRVECNEGRLAGYSDHPIKYSDGSIAYDNPQYWTKEVKALVEYMFEVMEWAEKLENWAFSMGFVLPKDVIPEKIQKTLKTFN